ncbi:hypothetical protein DFR42_10595 [Undibacterium pigrum]|uniref:Uncharacterized protein n=2 Tax=Undibacterium pigrum TaxID=401470 RepID=A0A318JFH7_9BURK|nr:hypothetical protein DFR42_10595 [Undibacterium pigrum]
MMFYGLIFCNISVLIYYVTQAILTKAPLLAFWLPALAFVVFYAYVGFKEHEKLNARTLPAEPESIGYGLLFLFAIIFLLAVKNWKDSPINIADAFMLAVLLSYIKDYTIKLLAMRKFSDFQT